MKDAIIKILTEHPIYQQDKDEDGTLFDYTSNIDNSDAQSIADKIILYLTEHPPQTDEQPNFTEKGVNYFDDDNTNRCKLCHREFN